jgi:hypothetical protein
MSNKLQIPKSLLLKLMIVSFIVVYFGGQDAITSTILYNNLDLTQPLDFQIVNKYNKKENRIYFPDFNFIGKIIETKDEQEISVSRGDFDKHAIGQIITVYKTKSDKYMTAYEVDNQEIIHIGKTGFSFVFIPTLIFFSVGLLCLIVVLKN